MGDMCFREFSVPGAGADRELVRSFYPQIAAISQISF
jgi:hypothetical protein